MSGQVDVRSVHALEELKQAAKFLASVSPDIPWHVTAFHKDYRMQDPENTPARALIRAAEIGYDSGLRYVYAGNLPGQVGPYEDTRCPHCGNTLVERFGFRVLKNLMGADGRCPICSRKMPGVWS